MGIFADFFISKEADACRYEPGGIPAAESFSSREVTAVELSSLLALLEGTSPKRRSIARFSMVLDRNQEKTIQRFPEEFVALLARVGNGNLGEVVNNWCKTPRMAQRSDAAKDIVVALQRLAKRARLTRKSMFIWNCFYPRIRPYRTDFIASTGASRTMHPHEIMLKHSSGKDLEINLAPHPSFGGAVTFSTFKGNLVLVPVAGDSLNVLVTSQKERFPRMPRNLAEPSTLSWEARVANSRGGVTPLSAIAFTIHLEAGIALRVDLASAVPGAQVVTIDSVGGVVDVALGASNVVHVSVYAGSRSPRRRRSKIPEDPVRG